MLVIYLHCCVLHVSEETEESSKTSDQTWGDTDRDYTYDEVSLQFAFKLHVIGIDYYN